MKAATLERRDGRYRTGCRLSLVLWRKRRSRDVRSLCVLEKSTHREAHREEHPNRDTAHSGENLPANTSQLRETT